MFKRSNERFSDGTRAPRRREERGFGPFTSGQLTLIVITVLILVAFPFAAFAVTGNNVFVTDATSGNHATVANGRLKVDAGTAFGLVPTVVTSGTVNATPSMPSQQFVGTVNFTDLPTKCMTLVTPPAGKAVVITTVHFQIRTFDNGPETRLGDLGHSGSSGCLSGNVGLDGVSFIGNVPQSNIWQGTASQELDFPSGLAIANGHTLTASVTGGPDDNWRITAFGYLIPASQCTTGCL
jgi:hypothetical protein